MSKYLIARVQNYKMSDVGAVGKEQERDEKYVERYYSNPDYNPDKTKDNLTLYHDKERDGKTWERYVKDFKEEHDIQGRFNVGGGSKKSQTNIMTGFIVTASPEYMSMLSESEQNRFFRDAFEALKTMYPTYHWVEVTVHRDEKNPHLQALALPLYRDVDKKITIFSTTKTQVGREHYREFQDHMYREMSKNWGITRGQPSERKHLNVKEFKELKEQEKQLQEREKALQKDKETFNKEKEQYKAPVPRKTILGAKYSKEDVEQVVNERNSAYAENERLRASVRDLKQEILIERENAIAWEKSGREEHEKRLELSDKLQDKDYLRKRIRELERSERDVPERRVPDKER